MASIDRPRSEDLTHRGERVSEDGPIAAGLLPADPEDPAAFAGALVAEEALSILRAVEARTSALDAAARAEADEIRRASVDATAPALALLRAMARELDGLVTDLQGAAANVAARRGDGD